MMSAINEMGVIAGLFSGSILDATASLMGYLLYGIVLSKVYNSEKKKIYIEKPATR